MAKFPGASELRATQHTYSVFHFELSYDNNKATYKIPLKKGFIVHDVETCVLTAFDATTPSLEVGDSDTSDGYLTSANIALTTAATGAAPAVKKASSESNGFEAGKVYQADGAIELTFDPGTDGTAGKLIGRVIFSDLSNDGILL